MAIAAMKFMQSLWSLAIIIALPSVAAQSFSASAFSELPGCASECITNAALTSSCSITNETCFCVNEQFEAEVQSCVRKECTVRQSLYTQNLTSILCDVPVRDRSTSYRWLISVMLVIGTVCVVQRIVYKYIMQTGLGADDWVIILQLTSVYGSVGLQVWGLLKNGFGKDIYTQTPNQIPTFLMCFQISSALYFVQITLLKISLLFFYLRIFPTPYVRYLLWGTIVFSAMYGIVYTFTTIFVCSPVTSAWRSWDGTQNGKCLDLNAISVSSSAISVAVDVWMLAVPLVQINLLNLDWRKKVFTAIMLFGGTCFTIVSILRLRAAQEFSSTDQNPTWNYMSISYYSALEINIGIVCACFPSLRLFAVYLFAKMFGKEVKTTGTTIRASDAYFQKRRTGGEESAVRVDSAPHGVTAPESVRTSDSRDDTDEIELVQHITKT